MQKWHHDVRKLIAREFTIYDRKMTKEYTHTKGNGTEILVREYDHGPTTHIIEDGFGNKYFGIADVWKDDQYRKSVGRNVSRGYAEEAMAYARNVIDSRLPKYEDRRIVRHTVHTGSGKSLDGFRLTKKGEFGG